MYSYDQHRLAGIRRRINTMNDAFLYDLAPVDVFNTVYQNNRVTDADIAASRVYRSYTEFLKDLEVQRNFTFATEDLKKNHIQAINTQCFMKASQLISKTLGVLRAETETTTTVLDEVMRARTNMEVLYNLKQVQIYSDSTLRGIRCASVEDATSIRTRLYSMQSIFAKVSDLKAILADPVTSTDSFGSTLEQAFTVMRNSPNFQHVPGLYRFSEDSVTQMHQPYTPVYGVTTQKYNQTLGKAGYTRANLLDIYKTLCRLTEQIHGHCESAFLDIQGYGKANTYLERIIKPIWQTRYEKDTLSAEQSLPVRLARVSTAISILAFTILPTLYRDIQSVSSLFSSLDDASVLQDAPTVVTRMQEYADILKFDQGRLRSDPKKYLQTLTIRAKDRIDALNKQLSLQHAVYTAKTENMTPVHKTVLDDRILFYSCVFSGASMVLDKVAAALDTGTVQAVVGSTDVKEYLDHLKTDAPEHLYTRITEIGAPMHVTCSLEFLQTMEQSPKLSPALLGYMENTPDPTQLKQSIQTLYTTVNKLTPLFSSAKLAASLDPKDQTAADSAVYLLSQLLSAVTQLSVMCMSDADILAELQ